MIGMFEDLDNFSKFLLGICILIPVLISALVLVVYTEDFERHDYCESLGYDEALTIQKQIEGESWIKCLKFKTMNNSLIEIEEWVRWKP